MPAAPCGEPRAAPDTARAASIRRRRRPAAPRLKARGGVPRSQPEEATLAALTIDVDMSEVLAGQRTILSGLAAVQAGQAAILAAIAQLSQKADDLMTEAQNTQAAVQADADAIAALDARLTTATGLLQAFLDANAGGPVNLAPVEQALAHLTGTVTGVETIATAETPPAPPAP